MPDDKSAAHRSVKLGDCYEAATLTQGSLQDKKNRMADSAI
jgi:hypothetical protein